MNALLLAGLLALTQAPESTVPSRVLLTWSDNPATSATVTWRTEGPVEQATAQIAVASANPKFSDSHEALAATTTPLTVSEGDEAFYHRVKFSGLKPNTRYSYRVGDGKEWSEWFDFRTAQAEPAPFKFVYFGDAQNDLKSKWSRVIRQAHRDAPYADFLLHAGDLVNIPRSDKDWGEWFYAGGWLHSTIPSIATPGNHEYSSGAITPYWRPQFGYPQNGVVGLEDSCYTISFQGALIVSLNSNEKVPEQAVWLENVLKKAKEKWKFVTFHHPVYSTAKGRDNAKIRDAWQPILQKYGVDLVLQGHDHAYGRKNVPTGVTTRDRDAGPVYVVSVSGPKMYPLGEGVKTEMTSTAENTQLYQIISVDGNRLTYEARTVVGHVHDAFELIKGANGKNRLVQKTPKR